MCTPCPNYLPHITKVCSFNFMILYFIKFDKILTNIDPAPQTRVTVMKYQKQAGYAMTLPQTMELLFAEASKLLKIKGVAAIDPSTNALVENISHVSEKVWILTQEELDVAI